MDVQPSNILSNHSDMIYCVDFTRDGTTLASGTYDGVVTIWDVVTGKKRDSIKAHSSYVGGLTFSSRSLLATGGGDTHVKLWAATSTQECVTLTGHESPVVCVAFSPDDRLLASGSGDETVILWDVKTHRLIRSFAEHRNNISTVAFSPDGSLLASGSADCSVNLWDLESGRFVAKLWHHGFVWSVAFSPDGRTLATASEDSTVKLWNIEMDNLDRSLLKEAHLLCVVGSVKSVGFSPDGNHLVCAANNEAGGDFRVRVWRVSDWSELSNERRHLKYINGVAFSPSGDLIASCSDDRTVKLWRL